MSICLRLPYNGKKVRLPFEDTVSPNVMILEGMLLRKLPFMGDGSALVCLQAATVCSIHQQAAKLHFNIKK